LLRSDALAFSRATAPARIAHNENFEFPHGYFPNCPISGPTVSSRDK
jgi:hypothetical protein